jgi:hypothetical protein
MMVVKRVLSVSVRRTYNICTKECLRMSPVNISYITISNQAFVRCYLGPVMCIV